MDEFDDLEGFLAPPCPADGMRMVATVVGWRCPMCRLAALPSLVDDAA